MAQDLPGMMQPDLRSSEIRLPASHLKQPSAGSSEFIRLTNPKASAGTRALVFAWFTVVVAALSLIAKHVNTPGKVESAPPYWPQESWLALDTKRPTLLMFAHPHCPCSRASLGELDRLLALCQGELKVEVVFIHPSGVSENWVQTDLWQKASALLEVTVVSDHGGIEAQRFHAATSGQVLLYDPHGRLMFQGGITASRGHAGDNPGRDRIVALARKETSASGNTPVFGCSLFDESGQERITKCRK